MKVLVVGGGGREHAICTALSKSNKVSELYCAPGNGGISTIATCVPIKATDIDGITAYCTENAIDFVMVAPDDPLALGMVNKLTEAGIRAFGPTAEAARIESSKAFSKTLMNKYGIPTAKYCVFDNVNDAINFVEKQGAPIVIKADGLALGKGVIIAETVMEAKTAVIHMMENKAFGSSGDKIVIEEFMTGPEVTVLCFTDGKNIVPLPSSQDHKRAFDGDKGLNTGGMGAISPSPYYTEDIAQRCMDEIFRPTIDAMAKEGYPFKGVIYFGLMLTPNGPKVIEYNARFGDPETQAVLSLLDSDIMDIFEAVVDGTLDKISIRWKNKSACCVVMASGGYPQKYNTGCPISGLDAVPEDITVFHAGTKLENGQYLTSGGRVLGVTALGDDLNAAIARAYHGVGCISFDNAHYRKDIGRK
ncbi:MAG: phosphoribosylamine--glycine ligase [Ruminococcaceae bacterium]|nr:phosphoribosylamine--glycine ligase [Oscillospiraceae bacterium]